MLRQNKNIIVLSRHGLFLGGADAKQTIAAAGAIAAVAASAPAPAAVAAASAIVYMWMRHEFGQDSQKEHV